MSKASKQDIQSELPAFDRAMRALINVPKADLDAELKRDKKPVKARVGKPKKK